jgi:hypothetical protein
VKMFARRISATERLVRSGPELPSPRERRSATSALDRPAGGVCVAGAASTGGPAAPPSAMPCGVPEPGHPEASARQAHECPGLSPRLRRLGRGALGAASWPALIALATPALKRPGTVFGT